MTLHVEVSGPEDGRLVLLLHAFPCDGTMWDAQAAAFAEAGWRVAVPDLPGYGRSSLLDAEPDLNAVAEVLAARLEAAAMTPRTIGGCSLGGYLAMALRRVRPEWDCDLLLTGTKATADSAEAAARRLALAARVEAAPQECADILREAVQPALLGPTAWASRPEAALRVEQWVAAARAETVAWYQRAMAVRPDSRPDLVGARIVDVWGAEDALASSDEQDLMLEAVGDGGLSMLITLPDAGHLAVVEMAEEGAELFVDAAASLAGRPREA